MNRLVLECPSCGEPFLADDEFCESCGNRLPSHAERDHAEADEGAVAAVTDRGLVHRRNEDAFAVAAAADGRAIAVVCDGVSASAAPHLASQAAADAAGAVLRAVLTDGPRTDRHCTDGRAACVAAMDAARDAVLEIPADAGDELAAPACTFVGTVWDGREISVGWVGDSRAYWIDESGATLITTDNSWAREQVDAGLLTEAAAAADSRAHAITRWLGRDALHASDQIATLEPRGAGRLVLCSDGLWSYAPSADELGALVGAQPSASSPIELARALTRVSLALGGHDNVTIAVVDVVPDVEDAVAEEWG